MEKGKKGLYERPIALARKVSRTGFKNHFKKGVARGLENGHAPFVNP
jgi:hypothetical protein